MAVIAAAAYKAPETATQYDVVITVQFTTTDQISILQADSGRIFLILTLHIQNLHAESFDVNPLYFYVLVGNVQYSVDGATFYLSNPLQPVQLRMSGSISGAIAFQIPPNDLNFTPIYKGFSNPSIQWIRA